MILTAAVGQVACLAVPGRGAGGGVDAAGLEAPGLPVDQDEGDSSVDGPPHLLADLREVGAGHGLLLLGQGGGVDDGPADGDHYDHQQQTDVSHLDSPVCESYSRTPARMAEMESKLHYNIKRHLSREV